MKFDRYPRDIFADYDDIVLRGQYGPNINRMRLIIDDGSEASVSIVFPMKTKTSIERLKRACEAFNAVMKEKKGSPNHNGQENSEGAQ